MALPDTDYPTDEQVESKIGKTPYVHFERNDYSVPHTHRKNLLVIASPMEVRVMDGSECIATHPRGYDKGKQIESITATPSQ